MDNPKAPAFRHLVVVRHATAESHSLPQLDFNRQLHPNGILEATNLGKSLHHRGTVPDAVVSSSAPRALQTAIILSEYLGYPVPKVVANQRLYNASVQDLLTEIALLDDSLRTVVLVGHNPGVSDIILYLSHHTASLPTAGAVGLEVSRSWDSLVAGSCRFAWHDFPR